MKRPLLRCPYIQVEKLITKLDGVIILYFTSMKQFAFVLLCLQITVQCINIFYSVIWNWKRRSILFSQGNERKSNGNLFSKTPPASGEIKFTSDWRILAQFSSPYWCHGKMTQKDQTTKTSLLLNKLYSHGELLGEGYRDKAL